MSAALPDLQWPVETERLSIRLAGPMDSLPTWHYRRLEQMSRWVTTDSSDWPAYRARFESPERLAKTLTVLLRGEVIGDLMIAVEDAWAQDEVKDQARDVQAELGWSLSPEYQGHGYATEAVLELIRICFEDLGLRRVTANCFADNESSWRLMERVGMRREVHNVAESLHRSGEWLDGFGYALLAEEWRAARAVSPESR